LGKKDDRYCFQYHLTNIKTGQIFEGRSRPCNLALGFAQDKIQILQNLMSYLECDGGYQNVNV
jgi:hypothetical protein